MKIESVEPILTFNFLLVRLRTDTGITGWGQTAYFSYPDAAERIVNVFQKYLVGKDPLQIERHWYNMFRQSPFRGAAAMGAISAVDIALWDVAGKHFQVPVYQLLGGRQRDKVRLHYLMDGSSQQTLDQIVERAKFALKEGFTAIKLDPLPPNHQNLSHSRLIEEVLKRLGALREVVGWDIDIGVEVHRKLVPGPGIHLAQYLEPFRIMFYEDPITPDSIDAHVQVAEKVVIPVAFGERHHTIHEFRDLLTRNAVHYLRPDVGLAGGITHCKKISTLAESFQAGIIPHNFISPLLTAASVQWVTAIPNLTLQEYCMWDEQEPRKGLLKTPLKREGGYLIPPEAPGLGVEVNEDFIKAHPYTPPQPRALQHLDGSVAVH